MAPLSSGEPIVKDPPHEQEGNDSTGSSNNVDHNPDVEGSFFALFCLEDVPVEMIEEVIFRSAENIGHHIVWLADTYENLRPENDSAQSATLLPIDSEWQSPFIGKTAKDAAEFIKNAPRERGLDTQHFIVLDKTLLAEKGWVMGYKISRKGTISSLPLKVDTAAALLFGYDRAMWRHHLKDWRYRGIPAGW